MFMNDPATYNRYYDVLSVQTNLDFNVYKGSGTFAIIVAGNSEL